MLLATQTKNLINEMLHADQGAKFRGLLKDLMPIAGDAYDTKDENWRRHLGASLIGRECSRELWYSFHWATLKRHEGRMVRLFNRGHLEEPRFVALLMMIGCKVWQQDANGNQFRIDGHRGHFGGSLDSVIEGIPELPGVPILAEYKTHGEKSFAKLVEAGVLDAKWEHFVQQQCYMGKYGLPWSLYCAVSKNTDEIHLELVKFDQLIYEKYYVQRPALIIDATTPPPRISESPGFFKCRFCDHREMCHGFIPPAVNCRTCVHSRVADAGEWLCTEPLADAAFGDNPVLSVATQRLACERYEMSPNFRKGTP